MSAPGGAPSPVPRSGSIGPGSGIAMPPQQQMSTGPPSAGAPPGSGSTPTGGMSQQNLNQIVGR
jgi:transcription initiation factor TFIID subunit 5